MIDERQGVPRLVVHNTFLELDDQPKEENRRPRAQTDITERKAPRKVSYHVDAENERAAAHGHFGLGTVSEDFPPGMADAAQMMRLSQLQAHAAGSTMAAAAAAASLANPLLAPPLPLPPGGYYPGLSPWPGLHPAQAFLPGALAPPLGAVPGAGAWPYALPYAGLDPTVAAMAAASAGGAAAAAAANAQARAAATLTTKGRGRTRSERSRTASTDSASMPAQIPAPKQVVVEKTPPDPPVNGTTIMLRNLPQLFTQKSMLDLLDGEGFHAKYDFVYLPMDFRNGVNLGYAFVNTLTHEDALRAIEIFQGYERWTEECDKVCEVSWAHPHQGLQEHVERYRNSPVMHPTTPEEYKPMIFSDGQRVQFPGPTKAIRAPKLKYTPNTPTDSK
eukprot:symbB.v1.2.006954.t1/scaffold416.1/size293898/13